jgi:hypothetical protein
MITKFSFGELHQGYQIGDINDATPDAHATRIIYTDNPKFTLIKQTAIRVQEKKQKRGSTAVQIGPSTDSEKETPDRTSGSDVTSQAQLRPRSRTVLEELLGIKRKAAVDLKGPAVGLEDDHSLLSLKSIHAIYSDVLLRQKMRRKKITKLHQDLSGKWGSFPEPNSSLQERKAACGKVMLHLRQLREAEWDRKAKTILRTIKEEFHARKPLGAEVPDAIAALVHAFSWEELRDVLSFISSHYRTLGSNPQPWDIIRAFRLYRYNLP